MTTPEARGPERSGSPGGAGRQAERAGVENADPSGGYDDVAGEFIRQRNPEIGVREVREWASELPAGAAVLDLGCGHGLPLTRMLVEHGFRVYGVDASPRLVAAFREHLPEVPVACEPVQHSPLFDRTFDGAIAWGLIFLLEETAQLELIHRVAGALEPGGRFLFTAPAPPCRWIDLLTGRESVSLGWKRYREILADAGLRVVREFEDASGNGYMDARKDPSADPRRSHSADST